MNDDENGPKAVLELADSCVRFVQEALGLRLDYTPDTLPLLDHYLREAARGAKPEVHALLAPAAGAYFGEVVRRTLAGVRWFAPGADYEQYQLEFERFFLAFNPIGVAMEVLQKGDVEGFGANFQLLDEARAPVKEALEQNPEVEPDDYYTLSMRFETLEQVADLLSALESGQPKPRHFGPEVYRAATPSAPSEPPQHTN